MTKLNLTEVNSEVLPYFSNVKILVTAIVMVPVALVCHLFMMCVYAFMIPNKVVDMITIAEKTKLIMRRKANAV